MIEANELRHGSWYLLNGEYHKYDITSLIGWDLKCYEPITLTPEILEKCGFDKKSTLAEITYKLNYVKLEAFLDTFYFNFNGSCIEINYVHQLQNLYYCLTGEEMKIEF